MTALYGHKWSSSYGEVADDDGNLSISGQTWLEVLKALTAEQIEFGLAQCFKRDDPWPPTLPEFRQLCKPPAKPLAHQPYKALPQPRAKSEVAQRELANIRAILAEGRRRLDAEKRGKAALAPAPAPEPVQASSTAAESTKPQVEADPLYTAYKQQFVDMGAGRLQPDQLIKDWATFRDTRGEAGQQHSERVKQQA